MASNDYIIEIMPGAVKDIWNEILSEHKHHSLTLGEPNAKDVVLYRDDLRKYYEYFVNLIID